MLKKITVISVLLLAVFIYGTEAVNIMAESVQSPNYQIDDLQVGNTEQQETSSSYKLLTTTSNIAADARFTSANYASEYNTSQWRANKPKVQCFETTTAGTTNCLLPAVANGMESVCGGGGCYNKARFEIDPQNNPPDTLYSVQITTDPGWNTWGYIDGNTYLLETASTHDINDYLSQAVWETPIFNILGLQPETNYYLRMTALHGDFSETNPSSDTAATTALPQLSIDIDIAHTGGAMVETAAPYSVGLNTLVYGQVATAADLIWLDFSTNIPTGAAIFVRDVNGGLHSSSTAYTLNSAAVDLAVTPGYGLVNYAVSQQNLGPLVIDSDYSNGGDIVGELRADIYGKRLAYTDFPLVNGRAGFYLKASAGEDTPAASDYADQIFFTVSGG